MRRGPKFGRSDRGDDRGRAFGLGRRRQAAARDGLVGEPPRRSLATGVAGGAGGLILLIARLVRLAVGLIVLVIVAAIAFRAVDANTANSIVITVHDWARSLVGPFNDVFTNHDPKVAITENWGMAALLYLIVGSVVASAIARVGRAGVNAGARHERRA